MAEVHRLRPHRRGWWRQWPIAVVLLGVIASLAVVALDHFRIGSLMLAVRSKRVDLIVLGVLGGALVVFALWVPPPA